MPLLGVMKFVAIPFGLKARLVVDMLCLIQFLHFPCKTKPAKVLIRKLHSTQLNAFMYSFTTMQPTAPFFVFQGMNNFKGKDDIFGDLVTFGKGTLGRRDNHAHVGFDPIGQNFGEYFVARIAQEDRSMLT